MKKSSLLIMFLINCLFISSQSIKEDNNHQNYVFPKHQTSYYLEGNTNQQVTWTVTNGSFSPIETITSRSGSAATYNSVSVWWDNPDGSTSKPPTGTVKAEIQYKEGGSIITTNPPITINQEIYSIKNVTPPPLEVKNGNVISNIIPYGEQNIEIYLTRTFNTPYRFTFGPTPPVSGLEWTIPAGWYSNNKTGIIEDGPSIRVKTDYLSEATIKARGLESHLIKDYSNYTQINIKRKLDYTSYPSSIKFGQTETYTYQVQEVAGVEYEWSFPSGWTIISGGNTNRVTVTKSLCAISADVKVRLKKNNQYSAWYPCPNSSIEAPDITLPSFEQFKNANIVINLPNDWIQSFSISGTEAYVVGATNSNSITCCFDKSGQQTITISCLLKGCSSVYSFQKNVNVSKSMMAISGKDIICSADGSNNFSISNLPSIASVRWSTVGSLSIVGANNSNSCNIKSGNGNGGTVKADVTVRNTTISLSKNIEISSDPSNPNLQASLSYTIESNGNIRLQAHTPQIYGIRGYMWNAQGISGGSSNYNAQTGPNGDYWSIPKGNYNVEVRVITQCGHFIASKSIYTASSYSSSIYPNPVRQTLYINIEENGTTTYAINNAIEYYNVKLYNIEGVLVKNFKINNRDISIEVSGLMDGNYFLHIFKDNDPLPQIHKIVIKK